MCQHLKLLKLNYVEIEEKSTNKRIFNFILATILQESLKRKKKKKLKPNQYPDPTPEQTNNLRYFASGIFSNLIQVVNESNP